MTNFTCSCIVVGAGQGTRFSKYESKLEKNIFGKPVYIWALQSMLRCEFISEIIVVGPFQEDTIFSYLPEANGKICVVAGGMSRTESVWNGLKKCQKQSALVCIHDAARPFVPKGMVGKLFDAVKAQEIDCVIPVLPIFDSLKYCVDNFSEKTVSKKNLVRTQTPQLFKKDSLMAAFSKYQNAVPIVEDETEILRSYFPAAKIQCVTGSFLAEKITDRNSVTMIQHMLPTTNRVGFGWDFHPFQEKRNLVLGGCLIKDHVGLEGDSDGDVVCHAVIDALLGAFGKGDIGSYFGIKTPSMMGVKSITLLTKLTHTNFSFSWNILNIDITVIAKKPYLAEYIPQMKENICKALSIQDLALNIKATTDKNMDDAGKGLGIRAVAVANLSIMEDWHD